MYERKTMNIRTYQREKEKWSRGCERGNAVVARWAHNDTVGNTVVAMWAHNDVVGNRVRNSVDEIVRSRGRVTEGERELQHREEESESQRTRMG